ncbi:MAG TPA: aldehyde dehydrogenase (NADP(+)) [Micromonosporaceae bacterium]
MIDYDQGMDPGTGTPVGPPVAHTSPDELDRIARAAATVAPVLARHTPAQRSAALRLVAATLERARAKLVPLADAETGLGTARLDSELTRTTVQLEMFAEVVAEGSCLEVVIDEADPTAVPAPRPDLRRVLLPIGPVAVFAASNFPFAFSVAGGDTASALAAGCPVVVKAHPGHPGLSARCAELVRTALAEAGLPEGSFDIVYGERAGRGLVTHPAIAAVGFTGSLAGGRALFDLATGRPDPIPFYGELGSLNPVVVTPGGLAAHAAEIVAGFVGSFTLGAGQFCTKPGLLFLPRGHGLDQALAAQVAQTRLGPLLNQRIRDGFDRVASAWQGIAGVRHLASGAGEGAADESIVEADGYRVSPVLLAVSSMDLVERGSTLLEECFGPAALVVDYGTPAELEAALDAVPASLTATVHADPQDEAELCARLLDRFSAKAGRIIWQGWPTGVAVAWAQHHGGPWPATTSPLHTSVGATAIRRFQRPATYQNLPDQLLPPAVQRANPWNLPRRINGTLLPARPSVSE